MHDVRSRGSSVSIVTKIGAGRRGLVYLAGSGNFSLCHRVQTGSAARPASYPIQWVLGDLSPEVKRPLTTHHHLKPKLKYVELYLHSLIRLHSVVLS